MELNNIKTLMAISFALAWFFKDLGNFIKSKIEDPTVRYNLPLSLAKFFEGFSVGLGSGIGVETLVSHANL